VLQWNHNPANSYYIIRMVAAPNNIAGQRMTNAERSEWIAEWNETNTIRGEGTTAATMTQTIGNLPVPNGTYRFEIVAHNADGVPATASTVNARTANAVASGVDRNAMRGAVQGIDSVRIVLNELQQAGQEYRAIGITIGRDRFVLTSAEIRIANEFGLCYTELLQFKVREGLTVAFETAENRALLNPTQRNLTAFENAEAKQKLDKVKYANVVIGFDANVLTVSGLNTSGVATRITVTYHAHDADGKQVSRNANATATTLRYVAPRVSLEANSATINWTVQAVPATANQTTTANRAILAQRAATTHFEIAVVDGNVTAAQFQRWLAGTLPAGALKDRIDDALLVNGVFTPTQTEPAKNEVGDELGTPNTRGNTLGYSTSIEGLLSGQRYTVFVFAVSDVGVRSIAGRSTFTAR
jgi:hypothetical protein